jgi:hypothetical protein
MNEDKVEYVFDQHSSQPPQVISMTQERYEATIAEARAAEREQCCQDVCWMCHEKTGQLVESSKMYWHKEGSWLSQCHATAIRQRVAQEQAG